MIGNKYSGDDIAREFQKLLSKTGDAKSPASSGSSETIEKKARMNNPEDFLVSEPDENEIGQNISKALDNSVEALANFAKDKKEKEEKEKDDKKEDKEEKEEKEEEDDEKEDKKEEKDEKDDAKDANLESDFSEMPFLVSSSEKNVLHSLGKIAADLRTKGEGLAADMVEVTAQDIIKDLAAEASKKMFVINTLDKMAKELATSGDKFASDMVKVTIEKIKNS